MIDENIIDENWVATDSEIVNSVSSTIDAEIINLYILLLT
jgi:hypothetical protein